MLCVHMMMCWYAVLYKRRCHCGCTTGYHLDSNWYYCTSGHPSSAEVLSLTHCFGIGVSNEEGFAVLGTSALCRAVCFSVHWAALGGVKRVLTGEKDGDKTVQMCICTNFCGIYLLHFQVKLSSLDTVMLRTSLATTPSPPPHLPDSRSLQGMQCS